MNRPTRAKVDIAILLPDLRIGGAELMHVQLAEEWRRHGYAVEFVILRNDGELLEELPSGVTVNSLDVFRLRGTIGPLQRYLRQQRPRVLLAAMWPLTVIAGLAAKLARTGTRIVISEHAILSAAYSGYGRLHRTFMRCSMAVGYRLADVRIAVSAGVAGDLACLSWTPRQHFRVVYNPAAGVEARMTPSAEVPSEISSVSKPLILTVGTLKSHKNHALLIQAFSRLPSDIQATLCILGEGDLRGELESQILSLGLEQRVLMPGFRMDTRPWYQSADLFVLASNNEGFGNVIVEALEQGVPVISTDCPSGPREILKDGRFGRLVPVKDADALASAMVDALQGTHDRDALKARARDFAVDKVAVEYLHLLLPDDMSGAAA